MDAALNIKLRFPLEDQPIVGYLAQFTLSFVQALLKTGYYQPGHTGSAVAKQRLYQEWAQLDKKDREVSFMIQDQKEEAGILIYGILSDVTPLKKLFSPEMADLFIPKFCDYFDRRHLVSFTLKPDITFEEFEGFIDLMSAPSTAVEMRQAITEMTENLVRRRIVHVSTVYAEELCAQQRSLHWMTQVVLTRLNKDLRMIPLYKHFTEEQRTQVKTRIFQDILRPLSNVTVLKEVLVNGDLISPAEETERIDMEAEFSRGLHPDQIWKVLSECANDLQKISPRAHPEINEEETPSRYRRLVFVVKQLAAHLSLAKIEEGSEVLMETLIREEIVRLEELPEPLIKRIRMKRIADRYLEDKQAAWNLLCEGGDEARRQEMIQILPLLLARNDFQSFGELLDRLQATFTKTTRSDAEFYSEIGIEGMRERMVSKLQDRQLANRKALLLMVEPLAPHLVQSLLPLCAHDDIWLRRNICRIFSKIGQGIIPGLIALAREPKQSWQVIRNVVMVLGDIGSTEESALQLLRRCQQHPHPHVREEVIASYGKIRGKQVEGFLLQELENKDMGLRCRVVHALGNFNPVSERYASFLKETVRKKRKSEAQSDERVEVNSCLAIESIAAFEPILCHALTPEKSHLLGLIGEKHHEKEYEARKAICRLLGVIGTKMSLPVLTLLLAERPWLPEDKEMVKQALQKIEQRVG